MYSTPYKALEIENLCEFIEKTLEQLINKNCTPMAFSQRYKNIIDRYYAGGTENEDFYEKLLQLIEEIKREQGRSTEMDLEEELEIFDLLCQDRKLTKAEEQKAILAAKNLPQKVNTSDNQILCYIMVQIW